jgi:cation diffusion facilitator family transporter
MAALQHREVSRSALIRRASLTALAGNSLLAVSKIVIGIISGSMAVVADGVDSSVDVLIASLSLFVSRVIAKPADAEHPWGHGRAETIATALLSFFLFFAGFQLAVSSARELLSGAHKEIPSQIAIVITVVSIIGKLLLALNQRYLGKKAASDMLKANAQNMTADVFTSVSVLLGLLLSMFFHVGFIDSIAALLVSLWVIKNAFGIFLGANTELMDGGSPVEQYQQVFDAVHSVAGAGNPHRTRMRRIAGFWDIDLDIEVDAGLSVREAHHIASEVETAIRERLGEVFDIMVHIEPAGDSGNELNEGYGLKER